VRKILLASAVAISFVSIPNPRPARAIECENCSTFVQQLVDYAQQAKTYLVEFQQLQTQLQQYANMVQNSIAIPTEMFSQVQSDLAQVQQLSNAASVLTGNSGSIVARLSSAGSFGNEVSSVGTNLGNLPQQFSMWQTTLGNSAKQLGTTLGLQQSQLTNNAAIMQAVHQHSQTAAGQLQAIQAGNEMAAANGAVMNQMAETMIALSQHITTTDVVAADRKSQEDAAMLHFTTSSPIPTTGQPGF
jgi:P-type conjugative transfer protein TrbJ